MTRCWSARRVFTALALAACASPVERADPDLVDGFWEAIEPCPRDCVIGEVQVLSTASPHAREDGVPEAVAPLEPQGSAPLDGSSDAVVERTIDVRIVEDWNTEPFGVWSRSHVDGGVVFDGERIGLEIGHDREVWYQPNQFRGVPFGRIEVAATSFCIGPDSAASIRRRATCDGPRHGFLGTLQVVAIGDDCDQPASGRIFVHYDEPEPECESEMDDHSAVDDC